MLKYTFAFIILKSEAQNPVAIFLKLKLYDIFILRETTDLAKELLYNKEMYGCNMST